MRRVGIITVLSMALMAVSASVALAAVVYDPAAAPNGTHLQTGTPSCSVTAGVVTCTSYELAGVGNADAEATLDATYSATVQCKNKGGKIVEVKSQTETATASTGKIESKNGRLAVPELTSGSVPSNADFEANATCPNGNWTKLTLVSSITLSDWTYTLTLEGFTSPYITITP